VWDAVSTRRGKRIDAALEGIEYMVLSGRKPQEKGR